MTLARWRRRMKEAQSPIRPSNPGRAPSLLGPARLEARERVAVNEGSPSRRASTIGDGHASGNGKARKQSNTEQRRQYPLSPAYRPARHKLQYTTDNRISTRKEATYTKRQQSASSRNTTGHHPPKTMPAPISSTGGQFYRADGSTGSSWLDGTTGMRGQSQAQYDRSYGDTRGGNNPGPRDQYTRTGGGKQGR